MATDCVVPGKKVVVEASLFGPSPFALFFGG